VTLKDNVIKELREETRIHVPVALLKGLIKDSEVFDYPQRSQRGRTITHAFHIVVDVKVEEGLPLVKGGDDADKAFWLPIADLGANEDRFFEDHIHIIRHFLGVA
jgi:bifunctional NMN adenylyltransferase/nudix hydrolase